MGDVLIRDTALFTMDEQGTAFDRGFVWWRDGRIVAVGDTDDLDDLALPAEVEVRSRPGHLVMPGLINLHTHLSNSLARGLYDELPLSMWASGAMWKTIEAMDPQASAAGTALTTSELLLNGVTTTASGEIGVRHPEALDAILNEVVRSGLRAVVARMASDSPDESEPSQLVPAAYRETPATAVAELDRLRARYDGPLVQVVPEAMGVLRCTEEMVRTLHGYATDHATRFSMHLASSPDERRESHKRFGRGSVAQLANWQALDDHALLAHVIHVDDDEVDLLAESAAGVSHNPVANASYAAGVARLPDLLEAGVRLGLGVDGASTNNGQNLWETAKAAIFAQKQHTADPRFGSAELALELVTRRAAAALGRGHDLGVLAPGYAADLICLTLAEPALHPLATLPSNLVYAHTGQAVREVVVAGRDRVVDGSLVDRDLEQMLAEADHQADRLIRQADFGAHLRERGQLQWPLRRR